jgi:hypothetical protein
MYEAGEMTERGQNGVALLVGAGDAIGAAVAAIRRWGLLRLCGAA